MSAPNLDDQQQLQQVHERAMHAMDVAALCAMRKQEARQTLALRYALKWEYQAVNLACQCQDVTTACLLRKSAAAIAGRVGDLPFARQLLDDAIAHAPANETLLQQDLQKSNCWLHELEAAAGIRRKRSWLRRMFS